MLGSHTRRSRLGDVVREHGSVAFSAALFLLTFSGIGLHYATASGPSTVGAAPPQVGASPAAMALGWGAPALHYTAYAPPVAAGTGHVGLPTGTASAGSSTGWSGTDGPIGVPGPGSMMMHCAKMTRLQALSSSQA